MDELEASGSQETLAVENTNRGPAERPQPRRPTRHSTPPERLTYEYATDEGEAMIMMADESEPATLEEALSGPDSKQWWDAMKAEMDSLAKDMGDV